MATYYVKNGGNDGTSGLSDALAWETISKVNSVSFAPDDFILFKRGHTWKEILSPLTSGSVTYQITFGAYDTGALPIITARGSLSGWNTSGNWTDEGTNRWSIAYSGNSRVRVWLSGAEAQRAHLTLEMSSTYNYFYSTNAGDATPINRLWVYATSNPASAYSDVEVSGVRTRALTLSSKNYLTFQYIDFRGGGGGGWECINANSCDYINFTYCSIGKDAGCYGLKGMYCDNWVVSYNTFDTGDTFYDYYQSESSEDALAMHTDINGWNVHHNSFINWGHTALGLNGREGYTCNNNLIHHNYFTNEVIYYGRAMGVDTHYQCTQMTGNKIYCNNMYKMRCNIQMTAWNIEFFNNLINGVIGTESSPGNRSAAGINIGVYEFNTADGMKIYNNIIKDSKDAGIFISSWVSDEEAGYVPSLEGIEIVNNIITGCAYDEVTANKDYMQILMEDDDGLWNNIGPVVIKNNLLYYSGQTDVVFYGHDAVNDYYKTVAELNAANGTAGDVISGNVAGEPLFVSSSDLHPTSGSAAIGIGIAPLTSTDYDGVTWNSPPSVGVYEYVSGGGNVSVICSGYIHKWGIV